MNQIYPDSIPAHINKYIKTLVLSLILLFPIVSASVRHGGTFVYFVLLLLSLIFGWRGWKILYPWEKRVLMGILIFFCLSVLSYFNTENMREGIKHLENFARFIAIIPIYSMIRYYFKPTANIFLIGITLGALFLGMQAWYQVYVVQQDHAHGAYHKIVFGDTAILFALILVVSVVTLQIKKWQMLVCLIAAGAAMYASVLSMTRAAWLLVPLVIPIWLWMYRKRIGKNGWIAIGLVLVISVTAGVFWQPDKLKSHFMLGVQDLKTYQDNPSANTSWGIRINLWLDSIKIFQRNFILGTGIGDLARDREQLVEQGLANRVYLEGEQAHSIYFQALATRGVVGFLTLVVCLIILPFLMFYKHWDVVKYPSQQFYVLSGVTFIIALAWFGVSEGWLTRNPFINTYCMFLIVFASSLASSIHANDVSGNGNIMTKK